VWGLDGLVVVSLCCTRKIKPLWSDFDLHHRWSCSTASLKHITNQNSQEKQKIEFQKKNFNAAKAP
jgi:hypothetical protein